MRHYMAVAALLTVGISCTCLAGVIKEDETDISEIDSSKECADCAPEPTVDIEKENLSNEEQNKGATKTSDELEIEEEMINRKKRSNKSTEESKSDETKSDTSSSSDESKSSKSSKSSMSSKSEITTAANRQKHIQENEIHPSGYYVYE